LAEMALRAARAEARARVGGAGPRRRTLLPELPRVVIEVLPPALALAARSDVVAVCGGFGSTADITTAAGSIGSGSALAGASSAC
jgi:hypothetical protein